MIVINGKVLLNNITGVERFTWEILKQWDKDYENRDVVILIPETISEEKHSQICIFKNIKIVKYGKHRNLTLWQQFDLPKYIKKNNGFYVSLSNSAPLLVNHGYAVLHDISPIVNKTFYKKTNRLKFAIETMHLVYGDFHLATDSKFSRTEIERVFRYKKDVFVAGCGWEHMTKVIEDNSIAMKYSLKPFDYYFSMSSLTPNKNYKWIMETAKLNPNSTFVIAGTFGETFGKVEYSKLENVKMIGRVTDGQAKFLMKNCKAFIFPTIYEGFGMPPLEAIASGGTAIVSDNQIMREIYGNSVVYIDNTKPSCDIDSIKIVSNENATEILEKHSWKKYATLLLQNIRIFANDTN